MICTTGVVMIYKPEGLDDMHIASDVMIYTLKRDSRPLDEGKARQAVQNEE